ncbi:sterol 3-beta-glucosyltransferase UGT80A2-like isoform X3 [Phragmites australis]|uniref:sterol 3-beta-glucosyltransferase UGT80A2-like isoform X3 n=1 Tax=Phragmites australis TaxID=29695 RepID=UPI002D76E3D1|nr:sterol 3-beta-glucosyltransferase UGT80A2-like isoform X3 [Phragmites australis]
MAAEESGSAVGEAAAAANGDCPAAAAAVASSSADDRILPRSSTMPGVIKNDEITNETAGPSNLQRSRTERRRQNNPADDPARQLFDEKIPIKKKLKMLNRIAIVKDDGTVVVDVPSGLEDTVGVGTEDGYADVTVDDSLDGLDIPYRPPMQIVILIVGTRGDVQPFVAIGKRLQDYGHRVRLATHANFKEFVLTAGLEFYPLGGDPKILAEYMVKNKGFLPSGPSEIAIQRKQIKDIIFSLLPACKDPDPDTKIPFKVDAIIANPPAYGHTHVAEALKVPIHIFFTMPWTPTSEFPHPLSRVKQPAGYRPVQDPQKMTEIIVQALEMTGQRGIINKGWGGLGTLAEPKDFVYLLDNCPHDWLFLQCKAVVHHGGAGTTAAGLKAACPTTIVPFFGDQPFWGDRVHARGLGPAPIPVDQFGLQKLVDAIIFMMKPEVKEKAVELAKAMESEDGVTGAVRAFLRHLPSKTEEITPPPSSSFLEFLSPLSRCLGCS